MLEKKDIAQFKSNVKKILKKEGKTQKWLNSQVFGVGESGRPKNDLFRKDHIITSILFLSRTAEVLNKRVDDLLERPSAEVESPKTKYIHSLEDRVSEQKSVIQTLIQTISENRAMIDFLKSEMGNDKPPSDTGERRKTYSNLKKLIAWRSGES